MFQIQAITTFCEIYAQLSRSLKLRCWRVLTFAGVVSLLELAITAALSLLGVALAAPESLLQNEIVQKILALSPTLADVVHEQKQLLLWLLVSLCVALACKSLSLAFLTWRQAVFAQEAGVYFSVRFYNMLLNAPYLWHVQQDMSMLQTRLTWARFSADFLLAFLQALGQFLAACILIAVVAAATPWAALLVCLCTGTSAGLTYYLAQRKVRYLNAVSMETEAGANRVAYPSLAGIREVKIYGQETAFLHQFTVQRQKFAKVQSMLPVVYPAPAWILDLTGMLILLVALLVLDGIGQLTVLAAVTWRILPTVNTLVSCLLQVQQHMVYTQDAVRFIAEMSQNSAAQAEGRSDTTEPLHLQSMLELRKVAFRYPDTPATSPDALHGLNIQIPYGAMVGFIGTSGAGKSTVVGLLTGLLTPTQGQVLVDGQPLDNAHKTAWLHAIGYVPQTPFLLNASIAANVAFTKWGQSIDYDKVKHCCKMAAIDFLDNLPEGLETIIGERGVRLSGGQVQRIAIARALYGQPQLILFDEATSALDGASEQTIQRTIETLEGHATLVLVAHRLTTVKNCDFIYWLGNGTIRMAGSPAVVLPEYEAYLQRKALHKSL